MAKTAELEKPAMDKREELTKAAAEERKERMDRCKAKIEKVLKDEKCILTANISTQEAAPGQFVLVGDPGIRAL